MGVISSRGRKHIDGQKHLTASNEIINITNKDVIGKIYIPIVGPNGADMEVLVNDGDQVKVGTKLAIRKDFGIPEYSPVSGKVIGKENRYHCSIGRPVQHLVIENDFKDEKTKNPSMIVPLEASRQEIVDAIKEAGIVGLGGAGFPTYVKYNGVEGIETILINGIECEPYLTTDYRIMKDKCELMLLGIQYLIKAANAQTAVIAIKKGKKELKEKIEEVLAKYPNVSLREVSDVYPMGWERTLIHEVFKKDYDRLPAEIGVIVNNAQTAISVADALINGNPITHRCITVSGDAIARPANVIVPVGTVAGLIIKELGGYTKEDVNVLAGGPMTSKGLMNDTFAITYCTGGITVMERRYYKTEPCLRCGSCIKHCPASIQPVNIMNAVKAKDNKRLEELETNRCIECGLCSFVCPSKIEVTDFVKKGKLQLKIAAMKKNIKK
jgi:electron transport complex protein RnfC